MSVCIAAISHGGPDSQHEIIAVVDRKVSSTDFSNEDATTKNDWLPHSWLVMFAGEDISPVVPIVRHAARILASRENTLENIMTAMECAYQEHLSSLCLAKVLGRWKFKSIAEFRENGKKQFGLDGFDSLCHQIEQIRLRCTFLVCGVDIDEQAHLFTVSNPGIAEVRDDPGYWAIGNGSHGALSLMSFLRQNIVKTLEETIYNVFASKLMAENASDVGGTTYHWRINRDGWDKDFDDEMDIYFAVSDAWEKSGKPLVPKGIISKITSLLEETTKRSVSQTSADQQ